MRWFASSSTAPSSDAAGPGEALLPPALLTALHGLDLVSLTRKRRASEGVHPALRHGREEEFFQHRPYVRGDDLRAVDWRASARTGHPLLKERHQPSHRPLTLLLDTSASMDYPEVSSKLRQAKVLAAALSYIALRRGDSVALWRLSGPRFERVARLRPAPRALHAIAGALAPLQISGEGDLAAALAGVGGSVARHGLVVLMSDLYGDERMLLQGVASLRRAAEVAVVQILADSEKSMPSGLVALKELEGGAVVSVDRLAIESYAARVAAWRQRLSSGASATGAVFVEAGAAEPAVKVLTRWLFRS